LKTKNLPRLALPALALVLVAGIVTPAFGSLMGDTVHFKITRISDGGIFCEGDTIVGAGVEVPNCFSFFTIDFDEESIWVQTINEFTDGVTLTPIIFEFTDLHWTDNPQGIIAGATLGVPLTISLDPISIGPHSIVLTSNTLSPLDCNGPTQCIFEMHIEIEHSVPVGGEILPIETTALLLASAQSFSWMIPVVLSVLGIGLFAVSRKSE